MNFLPTKNSGQLEPAEISFEEALNPFGV